MAQFHKMFPPVISNTLAVVAGSAAVEGLTNSRNWSEFRALGVPGQIGVNSGIGGTLLIRPADMVTAQDIEICFVSPITDTTSRTDFYPFRLPANAPTTPPNGTIYAGLPAAGGLTLRRTHSAGATATIATVAPPAGTGRQVSRVRVTGPAGSTRVQARCWRMNEPEPLTWAVDTTLTATVLETGFTGLGRWGTGFPAIYGPAISVGTDGDAAPDVVGRITGVTRVGGVGTPRTVRAVSKQHPGYYFDAISDAAGAFSLGVLADMTYTVFALDPNRNAIVFDNVAPTP